MRVVISDDYQDAVRHLECFARLADFDVEVYHDTVRSLDALAQRYGNADAIVLIRARTAISEALLDRLPRLRFISQTGHAASHVDLAACKRRAIPVSAAGTSTVATAELAWTLIMDAMRNVSLEARQLREGRWQTTLGRALHGRTLGIWGYGAIGRTVARFGDVFGMRVIVGGGRDGSRARAAADGREYVPERAVFFAECDVLSVHLRLSQDTTGSIGDADLQRMKSDALFVNTSRAEIVVPGALERALRTGRPGKAAVDVYEDEPVLNGAHPLLAMNHVLCTPHLGYVEKDTYETYFGIAFDQILAFAAGHPINVINP
jgi:D-3-phosphoglycerate dehydrogenase / 2-oxoglutarate reductase